jgi:hypothetical protein
MLKAIAQIKMGASTERKMNLWTEALNPNG